MFSPDDIERNWESLLVGKVIHHIKTERESRVPTVVVEFRDHTVFTIDVIDGAWFEGCLINTLRRAQAVTEVNVTGEGNDHIVEVRASSFPLFVLIASTDKLKFGHPFPLILKESTHA